MQPASKKCQGRNEVYTGRIYAHFYQRRRSPNKNTGARVSFYLNTESIPGKNLIPSPAPKMNLEWGRWFLQDSVIRQKLSETTRRPGQQPLGDGAGIASRWNDWERRSQSYFDSGNGVPRKAKPALGELWKKHPARTKIRLFEIRNRIFFWGGGSPDLCHNGQGTLTPRRLVPHLLIVQPPPTVWFPHFFF